MCQAAASLQQACSKFENNGKLAKINGKIAVKVLIILTSLHVNGKLAKINENLATSLRQRCKCKLAASLLQACGKGASLRQVSVHSLREICNLNKLAASLRQAYLGCCKLVTSLPQANFFCKGIIPCL